MICVGDHGDVLILDALERRDLRSQLVSYTEMMDAGSGGRVTRCYTDAFRGCLSVDLSTTTGTVNRAARRSMT